MATKQIVLIFSGMLLQILEKELSATWGNYIRDNHVFCVLDKRSDIALNLIVPLLVASKRSEVVPSQLPLPLSSNSHCLYTLLLFSLYRIFAIINILIFTLSITL